MPNDERRTQRELDQIIKFHGHFCGGIVVGYVAARIALERLGSRRAEDEELVAIVENDSCAVDAVQVVTGCTLGKGNLIFRDYGKHVYTFAVRPSGRAVRVSRKPGPRLSPEELLNAPIEEVFWVEELTINLPPRARIRDSLVCDRCGEPVMEGRTRKRGDRALCIPCAMRRGNGLPKPPIRNRRRVGSASGV